MTEFNLQAMLESMEQRIRDDLREVHKKLDKQNGRLTELEVEQAVIDNRMSSAVRWVRISLTGVGLLVINWLSHLLGFQS
jgi:hypothetical protein